MVGALPLPEIGMDGASQLLLEGLFHHGRELLLTGDSFLDDERAPPTPQR